MNSYSSAFQLWKPCKPLGSSCCFVPALVAITSCVQQRRPSPPSLLPTMTWQSSVAYASCWGNPASQPQRLAGHIYHWHLVALGSNQPRLSPPLHIELLGGTHFQFCTNNCHTSPPKCSNFSNSVIQPRLLSKPHLKPQAHCRPRAGTPQPGKTSSMAPCHPQQLTQPLMVPRRAGGSSQPPMLPTPVAEPNCSPHLTVRTTFQSSLHNHPHRP